MAHSQAVLQEFERLETQEAKKKNQSTAVYNGYRLTLPVKNEAIPTAGMAETMIK